MDTRDTPEQAELRRAARQLAGTLGPSSVGELDHGERRARLLRAVSDAGWFELRSGGDDGAPLATGVEACIVAEALGAAVADVQFIGPLLAADLARRAGTAVAPTTVVAFDGELVDPVVLPRSDGTRSYGVDVPRDDRREALVLLERPAGATLATVALDEPVDGTDLTRVIGGTRADASATPLSDEDHVLTADDLTSWRALGLALCSADLVGVMRGVIGVTVDYATERRQYGVAIGSFQAVQHLLAEAQCLLEGSMSITDYATWAVDALPPSEALVAAAAAKAYSTRAARTACETAIQVHGGIGNTWECIVHVYLRRALLSSRWFGDDEVQLRLLQKERLGVGAVDGLS
jgi:alkylation response protein AidB-like acyl-CoA dehydrogenase